MSDLPPPLSALPRRTLLGLGASAIALLAGTRKSFALTPAQRPAVQQFLALSRVVTGYDTLDETIAARTYDALCAENTGTSAAIVQLAALAQQAADAKTLQAAAAQANLTEALNAILIGWYTGTVASKSETIVIAYRDALMYRPTADGLTVPTYCNKGPLWWQDTLPPGITRVPVNNPKVL